MRSQWLRLLILRCRTPSQPYVSQVHHLRSFTSSLVHTRAHHVTPKPFVLRHHFSSSTELAVEPPKPPSDEANLLADIFAKPGRSGEVIKLDLDSKNVVITHDFILSFLRNPDTDPDVARRVFDWVSESQADKLSSKSYNMMLGILGGRGLVKETWDMIEVMKKKGYGVKKGAFVKIFERFQKDGLNDDIDKLNELYDSGSVSCKINASSKEDDGQEMVCHSISNMIKREVWGDDLETQLQGLNVKYSIDIVTRVLENLRTEPNKALIFFRWVQENGLVKHDERTFSAMAAILCEEDHSHKFWKFVDEMRGEGHEMTRETYFSISKRFVEREMIKDAVDLYEFAMIGANKPTANDCTFLLKKIVVSKELDIDLFSRVLTENRNILSDAILDSVMKSLTSVGRLTECNKIFSAMKKAGYVPSVFSQCKIAFKLSSCGKTREALEFMNDMVNVPDHKIWESLVSGFCTARDLNAASDSFRDMVEKIGPARGGNTLDVLIGTYCRKNKPMDAYKFISEMVNDKGVSPRHSTYKTLTSKLLAKKHFEQALDVMSAMKSQGYPPDLDSFVEFLSRKGNADEAVKFLRAMTCKRFPSTPVFIRLFEAYIEAGRQSEAQDFLSKCPRYIKNHADVLNLFCSEKSKNAASVFEV